MKCNSCGGEYDEKLSQCPYCESENEMFARKEQREYLMSYGKKIEELDQVPGQMAKKASDKVVKIAGVLVILFLVLVGAVWLISRKQASESYERHQRQLAKLEAYYQTGDYFAMGEYLDEINEYGGSYQKYEQVEQVYFPYEDILKSVKFHEGSWKEYLFNMTEEEAAADYFLWDIKECFRQLRAIREIEKEDFPYGNEEGISDIRDKYTEILKTELLLTPEEIEEGIVRYADSDTDYMDLAAAAAQRLVENLK